MCGGSILQRLAADPAADGSHLPAMASDPDYARRHPGFLRRAWAYHTITDTWTDAGETPASPVTTPAVSFRGGIVLASGEERPRVRIAEVWQITARGGQQMPWWATGCSIFATRLSSITFMSIPAKAFAQNWVYALGNLSVVAVAPVAVFLALPFFRRINATSASEYLELRFNRAVRLLASGLFTSFHAFRMAIVMSLAALALAVVTPLTPAQSVLLMGALSILYCTLGGIEAVIWTDTIQAAVLLGGAALCLTLMIQGTDGGLAGAVATAAAADKLRAVNFHLDPTSASLALWVVIGGWLFAFYRSHPEKLDPTFTTDQIFPLFILHETPPGVAGLIVAGIFAAAQSTISTSMNSIATAVVTDFLRPHTTCSTEAGYLRVARWLTVSFGVAGTLLGLVFVDPGIRSLFDSFIAVLGSSWACSVACLRSACSPARPQARVRSWAWWRGRES